ncbi:MAG: PAS domain-containing protein [Alphaproteobacteria bacterium]
MKAHPYTQAVLDAWRRLADGQLSEDGPTTEDFPGLVGNLFVLNHVGERDYSFQRVGHNIEKLFGRQLAEHNFLSLWSEPDRTLVSAALASAHADQGPAIVRARGETLDGRRIELELTVAPLPAQTANRERFLGLCQSITPDHSLGGRPLRRLQAIAIYPPAPEPRAPTIRLVSSK